MLCALILRFQLIQFRAPLVHDHKVFVYWRDTNFAAAVAEFKKKTQQKPVSRNGETGFSNYFSAQNLKNLSRNRFPHFGKPVSASQNGDFWPFLGLF